MSIYKCLRYSHFNANQKTKVTNNQLCGTFWDHILLYIDYITLMMSFLLSWLLCMYCNLLLSLVLQQHTSALEWSKSLTCAPVKWVTWHLLVLVEVKKLRIEFLAVFKISVHLQRQEAASLWFLPLMCLAVDVNKCIFKFVPVFQRYTYILKLKQIGVFIIGRPKYSLETIDNIKCS